MGQRLQGDRTRHGCGTSQPGTHLDAVVRHQDALADSAVNLAVHHREHHAVQVHGLSHQLLACRVEQHRLHRVLDEHTLADVLDELPSTRAVPHSNVATLSQDAREGGRVGERAPRDEEAAAGDGRTCRKSCT